MAALAIRKGASLEEAGPRGGPRVPMTLQKDVSGTGHLPAKDERAQWLDAQTSAGVQLLFHRLATSGAVVRCHVKGSCGCAGEPTSVVGARRVRVETPETAAALIKQAGAARASEATAMNATSSRSHSIFMLYITGRHAPTSTLVQGALNLVDLAGRYALIALSVCQPRSDLHSTIWAVTAWRRHTAHE